MNDIFYGCNSLKDINLSNFNTQNVTSMYGMLNECNSLTNINLSNFKLKMLKIWLACSKDVNL